MEKVFLSANNSLILNNDALVKCITRLWQSKGADLIFIRKSEFVELKIKHQFPQPFFESIGTLKIQNYESLVNVLKIGCRLSLDTNIPQSGMIEVYFNREKFTLRSSFHPTNKGDCLNMRIIRPGFFQTLENPERFIGPGLNVIGGRTCSGKTTFFYSLLSSMKTHIITIEDPIETLIPEILQTDCGHSGYEDFVKSAMRQNPDLIAIGEIRDSQSAKSAVKAALTGHRVLSTIHISKPENLLLRFQEMKVNFADQVICNLILLQDFKPSIYVLKNGVFSLEQ